MNRKYFVKRKLLCEKIRRFVRKTFYVGAFCFPPTINVKFLIFLNKIFDNKIKAFSLQHLGNYKGGFPVPQYRKLMFTSTQKTEIKI